MSNESAFLTKQNYFEMSWFGGATVSDVGKQINHEYCPRKREKREVGHKNRMNILNVKRNKI